MDQEQLQAEGPVDNPLRYSVGVVDPRIMSIMRRAYGNGNHPILSRVARNRSRYLHAPPPVPFAAARRRASEAEGQLRRACIAVGVAGFIVAIGFVCLEQVMIGQSIESKARNVSTSYPDSDGHRNSKSTTPTIEVKDYEQRLRELMKSGKNLNWQFDLALILGALKRNRVICIIWITLTAIETVFHTAGSIYLNFMRNSNDLGILGGYIFHQFLQIFFMAVVALYVKELDKLLVLERDRAGRGIEMPASGPPPPIMNQEHGAGNNANGPVGTQPAYSGEVNASSVDPPPPYKSLKPLRLIEDPPPAYQSLGPQQFIENTLIV